MAQQAQVSEEQARAVAEESRESGWDKPSLAKELFLGRFPLDLIHPFPRPADQEAARTEEFLGRLRDFLGTVDGRVIERDAKIPDEYVKGLAELGCFGMKIPSEYGGLNLSQVAYNRALMMVSSVHASLGALLSAHQSIGVPEPLKLAGSQEQKRKFLPRCAAGAISAFLLTEPDVGSDPARLASTATPVDGGAAYELDGVKLWTTNGVVADLLVVMAAVPKGDGHRGGISAFVVEADSPGITAERCNALTGLRGIENGLTRLHNVRVPAESLAAGGGRAVPVEQVVRDLRINRIFEGSSEIMRLLIAREAVDAHLSAAGDLANAKADLRQKAKAAVGASGFYAKWLPQLVFGEGQRPTAYREFGNLATHLRFVERSARKPARNTFYGMALWQAALDPKQGFLGRVVDIGAELFAIAATCVRAEAQRDADSTRGEQSYEL